MSQFAAVIVPNELHLVAGGATETKSAAVSHKKRCEFALRHKCSLSFAHPLLRRIEHFASMSRKKSLNFDIVSAPGPLFFQALINFPASSRNDQGVKYDFCFNRATRPCSMYSCTEQSPKRTIPMKSPWYHPLSRLWYALSNSSSVHSKYSSSVHSKYS